jgi:hypothetical protein
MRLEGLWGRVALTDPETWSTGWWQAAWWVPVGYASTKLYGPAMPTVAVGFCAVAVALVHRFAPGVVELVAGSGALIVAVNASADGDCHVLVGDDGVLVLMAFGGGMCASAIVRLLGSANAREAARHLLIAVVCLELALSAVTPVADAVTSFRGRVSTAAVLGVVLLVLAVGGIRARAGLALLGAVLVAVESLLAVTGGPCHSEALRALVGTVIFAAVATWVAHYAPRRPEPTGHGGVIRWAGQYDDRGPTSHPEPPRAEEWPGRARRPRGSDEFWS